MNRYQHYCVEDFVLDAEFQNYVRYKAALKVAFWDDYQAQFPAQCDDIQKAKILLEGIYTAYGTQIDDGEIESEITGLINRIRAEKGEESTKAVQLPKQIFELRPLLYWISAASLVLIGAYLSWHAYNLTSTPSYTNLVEGRSLVEKYNKTSSRQTLRLEDGTVVILEPGSRLSMPIQFPGEKREVYLSGEAFFTVARDIKRPFLVYSNKLVTRVLGTSFIVKALRDASKNTVEVKEGKVSVFNKNDYKLLTSGTKNESKGIVLTPNQKIVFEEGVGMVKSLRANPEIVPDSKVVVRFDYKNTPVVNVLQELKSAYQVDIIYDTDLLSDCPLTATLVNQSLLEKLNIICEVIEAKYEVIDGKIMIYGKSCLQ